MSLHYFIGTSGWHYDHWRDRFYPEKLIKAKWLEFYASHFTTVELNNSFYRLPSEAAFTTWHDSSPANFTFAVKVSLFITHIKRLANLAANLKAVYIYFNNDAEAFAVSNAIMLRAFLERR